MRKCQALRGEYAKSEQNFGIEEEISLKRYFPSIKQYSWILLVCVVVSSLAGFALAKKLPLVYQVSTTILVQTGSPGTSATSLVSTTDPTQSLAEANTYASEIPTREVMLFIYKQYPDLAAHNFTADDLLVDITAVPSTTASTVAVTAIAGRPDNAVMLANDVADGFVMYVQQQSQKGLDTLHKNLTTELATYQAKQQQLQTTLAKIANTNDPNYIFTNNSLSSVNKLIDSIQAVLVGLPSTVRSDASVIQHAVTADATTTSKTSIIVAATAGVGLIIGLLIMLLMIFLEDRLRSEDQVKEKLGIAYLGSVTSDSGFASKPTKLSGTPLAEIGDVYAGLRLTGLKSSSWQAPRGGVLLVTSAQEAEGKTTIAAALATNFASAGGSVVVMDGNMRKPGTHIAFDMGASNVGLSSVLKSSSNVDDVVKRSNIPGVWVMPAGMPVSDPAILLEQKLPLVLNQMRNKTDMVIIDGPALLSSADALLLATMCDCVIMVVDVRHDKMALLLRAKELLGTLAKVPAGVVMNRAPKRKRNRFYATAPVVNVAEKAETPTPVQNHYGNGHNGSNAQKSDALVTEASAVRTSPPVMNTIPLTPAARPASAPASMPVEPPPLSQVVGGMQRPPSNPGNMTELPMPPANAPQAQRPVRSSVPPSPSRIPPTPSRPDREK
jgi:capsular exopolysaccharide synthesis family protein